MNDVLNFRITSVRCIQTDLIPALDHRRAVAQPCVNGDRLSHGEWQNSTPRRSETPQPIDTKFETGDYVRETTLCAKFRANPSIGGFSASG